MPDLGSIKPAQRDRRRARRRGSRRARARCRPGRSALAADGLQLPHQASNARARQPASTRSTAGRWPAMGPQVGYYSPQIFVEYELHGGGIDVSGVTFPGASP